MKKKQYLIFIFSAILIASFILGLGPRNIVKLLDDSLLIDLDEAIVTAPIGYEGNRKDYGEDSVSGQNAGYNYDKIVISISDTKINYNGHIFSKADGIEMRLRKEYSDYYTIVLEDNYAESHVYKEVRNVLETLNKEIGLKYEEAEK